MAIGDKGARQGEVCAFCGDPMNAGFQVCSDCGAVRKVEPSGLCILLAFGLAYLGFSVAGPADEPAPWVVALVVFLVTGIFGPKKVTYYRKN